MIIALLLWNPTANTVLYPPQHGLRSQHGLSMICGLSMACAPLLHAGKGLLRTFTMQVDPS